MPANPFAVANKVAQSTLQDQINSKGMCEYIHHIRKAIVDHQKALRNLFNNSSDGNLFLMKIMSFAPRLLMNNNEKLQLCYQQLNSSLDMYQQQLRSPPTKQSQAAIAELEKACESKMSEIKEREAAAHKLYKKNMDNFREYFKSNQGDFKQIMQDIYNLRQSEIPNEMKSFLLMISRYLMRSISIVTKRILI